MVAMGYPRAATLSGTTTMRYSISVIALAAISLCGSLAAQQKRVAFSAAPSPASPDSDSAAEFLKIHGRAISGKFDQQAAELADDADACTRKIFNLPALSLTTRSTYRNEEGDNLAIGWTFSGERA